MACRELAALRLGLMNIVGIENEAAKQHDLDELGNIDQEPHFKQILESQSLRELKSNFEFATTKLSEKVAFKEIPKHQDAYYKSLQILTKKVEYNLDRECEALKSLYADLEDIHDYVHEVYPANELKGATPTEGQNG